MSRGHIHWSKLTAFVLLALLAVTASTALAAPAGSRGPQNRRLAWAVWRNDVVGIKEALKAGADPNARFPIWEYADFRADTPPTPTPYTVGSPDPLLGDKDPSLALLPILMVASGDGLKALAAAGADLEARDADGNTPLLFQAGNELGRLEWVGDLDEYAQCQVQTMDILLRAGADVHARNHDGDTALHLIHSCLSNAGLGRDNQDDVEAAIRLLVRHGADVNARNNAGKTVLQTNEASLATGYLHGPAVIAMLSRLGARSPRPAPSRADRKNRRRGNSAAKTRQQKRKIK